MKCPFCGHADSKVVDSRLCEDDSAVRRRRQCISCRARFTTYEKVELIPLQVIKKDGRRESFDRNKLISGIMRACEKREISTEVIDAIVRRIEERAHAGNHEIHSAQIGELVMEELKALDQVAYVRFASVYREFKDVDSFMRELESIREEE